MNSMQRLMKLPARQLMGLTVAVAAVIALLAGAWMWSQAPDYRVLYSNLADRDGGAIVQSLNQMNIPYKYSDGGGSIMVPSNMVYDTRLKLASQGLPKGGITGMEIMEQQKFGTTQFQEQVNYQRGLEGELAKSIQSISSVQAARVHLAIPAASVFMRDQQKPSASVLVNLYPGKSLDRAQVNGILHLVSSSVSDLTGNNVSIIDQNGTLLTAHSEVSGLDPTQLAYIQEVEQSYVRRILAIVEPIVGAENVRAQVTADVDFTQVEQTAETYKPNNTPAEAAIRSQVTTDATSSNANGTAPGGVPGAASNQPSSATNAGSNPLQAQGQSGTTTSSASTHKENTTNYEVDKTVQLRKMQVGALKRLSAAIVINNRKVLDAKGKATQQAIDKPQMDQITDLARDALGFSKERGDVLNVVNMPFTQTIPEPVIALPLWKDPENIALGKDIGKNVLVGLLALYLVFGVLRPSIKKLTQVHEDTTELIEQNGDTEVLPPEVVAVESNLDIAKRIAREDPKIVANVVRNWVTSNE